MQFYTYLHCKPNGDPFYVGKGFGYRSHKFSTRNRHHKNVVAKCGGKESIEILIFPRDSERDAFDDEMKWIQVLREAGYELANKTDGGDGIHGFHHSNETRTKMSQSQKGRKPTAETIAKIKANNKAGTPEVRAKMSAAARGRTLSFEHRKRIGTSQKGRPGKPHTEASKEKIRLARKLQVITEETKQKLSLSGKGHVGYWLGKKHSSEQKEKISSGLRRAWEQRRLHRSAMVHAQERN